MKYRKFLVLLWLIPLVLYYSDSGDGPDNVNYRSVAEKIIKEGHLNILASHSSGYPRLVSPTLHYPIHQAIGGAVYFIPPVIMAPVSRYLSSFLPEWPSRFQSLFYHQRIWEGFIAWLLGFWTCLLVYRVARIYYSARAASTAIALCALGGPILVYVARWPSQTNLPPAFLAALLLYVYHFADRRKCLSWLLMGAVLGFGVTVRNEFIVWALLPAYGIIRAIRSREGGQKIVLHSLLLVIAASGFLISIFLVHVILYGSWENTYSVLIDIKLLTEMPQLLFGPRNGLFSFWPILLLAIIGYIIKFRANPGVNHILFSIILLSSVAVYPFWLAEMGVWLGQRQILLVVPCFMLFLARLLDGKKRFFWVLLIIGIGCVFWSVLTLAIYHREWPQGDGTIGFLKTNTLPEMFIFVFGHAKEFFPEVIRFCFLPKHRIIWLLLPVFIPIFLLIVVLQKTISREKALPIFFVALSIFCMVTLIFLAGAGERGREFYHIISQTQPDGWLIYNCRYHIGEYFDTSLHYVAYFLDYNRPDTAAYFEKKAIKFLQKEAPQHIQDFRQVCEALRLRHSLGWKRVFPVAQEEDIALWLQWYYREQNGDPPLKSISYRIDMKEAINNFRVPEELFQR